MYNFVFKNKFCNELIKALLAILFGFIVIFLHTYFKQQNLKLLQTDQKFITIEAKVVKINEKPNENKTTLILENITKNGSVILKRASVSTKSTKTNLQVGSKITAVAYFFAPQENIALNSINMKKQAFISNLESYGYLIKIKEVVNKNETKPSLLTKTRNFITLKIAQNMNEQNFALANALLTGNKNFITESNYQNIRKAGIAHLFAISGYHISLIGAFVFFVFRFLLALVPYFANNYNIKAASAVFAIVIVLFYVALVSFPASAVRAGAVFTLLMLSYVFNQSVFSYKTFANVALLMLIYNPYYVYNIGFILSFSAYLAILYITKTKLFYKINKINIFNNKALNYVLTWLLSLIAVSSFIQLVTLLEIALFFKEVPLYGTLTNIIAIPIFGIFIMPFLFIFAILSYFNFSYLILKIPEFALNFLTFLSGYIAKLPYSTLNFYNIDYVFILIFMLALTLMLLNSKTALLLLLVSCLGFINFKNPNIIIDFSNQTVMFLNNKTLVSNVKLDKFNKNIIMKSYNLKEHTVIATQQEILFNKIANQNIYVAKESLQELCHNASVIIAKYYTPNNCPAKTIALASKNKGILNIYIKKENIKVKYNVKNNANKPWNY